MTIRELQYAIQDVIDEKGVCDNAKVKIIPNKDGEPEIFAVEHRLIEDEDGCYVPYHNETRLGKV